jgi:hypothetical protein
MRTGFVPGGRWNRKHAGWHAQLLTETLQTSGTWHGVSDRLSPQQLSKQACCHAAAGRRRTSHVKDAGEPRLWLCHQRQCGFHL